MRLVAGQAEAATETLVAAFTDDPTWSWMFEGADDPAAALRGVISILIAGGLVNDSIWTTPGCESVAIWVPRGRDELTHDQEAELDELVANAGGSLEDRLFGVFDAFNSARAKAEPHHYLSMFGTQLVRKGEGYGSTIFRAALEEIDRHSAPCYLESSNPENDSMYEHFGFESLGLLETPPGCISVRAMWREAQR